MQGGCIESEYLNMGHPPGFSLPQPVAGETLEGLGIKEGYYGIVVPSVRLKERERLQ